MKEFSVPVLLTIWDKPKFVEQQMNIFRKIKPRKIFVFSDIKDNQENKSIYESRRIVEENLDWDVEVQFRYNKNNEGAALGIYNAISWAFEHTEKLIVLEHDYIPALSFFKYCDTLLKRYMYDERIWIISGLNHFEGRYNLNSEDSYFFSKYASIAGFATWKRCWDQTDFLMNKWQYFDKQNYRFDHVPKKDGDAAYKIYKKFYEDKIKNNDLNTWDKQFGFAIWSNKGTGIVPAKNLISMVGVEGVNTKKASAFHLLKRNEKFDIKKHPDFIQNNWRYDDKYYKSVRIRDASIFKKVKFTVQNFYK